MFFWFIFLRGHLLSNIMQLLVVKTYNNKNNISREVIEVTLGFLFIFCESALYYHFIPFKMFHINIFLEQSTVLSIWFNNFLLIISLSFSIIFCNCMCTFYKLLFNLNFIYYLRDQYIIFFHKNSLLR